jgi:putative endonuclease
MNCLPELSDKQWWLYMVRTVSGKLYTGISTDVERRFQQHLQTSLGQAKQGAKFFRSDAPQAVVYREACADRATASQREAFIKRLSRAEKQQIAEFYLASGCNSGDNGH